VQSTRTPAAAGTSARRSFLTIVECRLEVNLQLAVGDGSSCSGCTVNGQLADPEVPALLAALKLVTRCPMAVVRTRLARASEAGPEIVSESVAVTVAPRVPYGNDGGVSHVILGGPTSTFIETLMGSSWSWKKF
jgi:hypothetical protein